MVLTSLVLDYLLGHRTERCVIATGVGGEHLLRRSLRAIYASIRPARDACGSQYARIGEIPDELLAARKTMHATWQPNPHLLLMNEGLC